MTEIQDAIKAGEQTLRNWGRAGWEQTIIYTVVLIVLAALLPQAGFAQSVTDYAMLAACTGAIIAALNQNAAALGATLTMLSGLAELFYKRQEKAKEQP